MHVHQKNIAKGGLALTDAKKVMIMVHGRGSNPDTILNLSKHLKVKDFALLAPRAKDNTWYPFSFMAPTDQNEPGLSSALQVLNELVEEVIALGFDTKDIYFLGFSQGACLASEFVARNAKRYGGVFIYSGGVIGQEIDKSNYHGDFSGTPILIGCSDVDAHIPLKRVKDTTALFLEMNADVTEEIFPNAPHTIFEKEIKLTNEILRFGSVS